MNSKSLFCVGMIAISLPILFPFFAGLYISRITGESHFMWAGLVAALFFILCARLFEVTIRREGVVQGWSEAYDENGRSLFVGAPYPGWKFPKLTD